MKYIVVNCEHYNGEINTPNFLGVYNTEAEARQFIEESIAEGLRVFPTIPQKIPAGLQIMASGI